MLIVCPNCATSYRVEPASLGAAGRSVRCVRCRSVWFAHDSSALTAVAEGFRDDLTTAGASEATEQHEFPSEAPPAAAGMDEPAPESTEAAPAPPAEEMPAAEVSVNGEQAPLAPMLPEHGMLRSHEPIGLTDAPAFSTIEHDATVPLTDATIGGDVETVAARRARQRARRRLPSPGLPATIMALIAINAILIGWRADVVKVLPQTASLYAALRMPVNLRGLDFADVTTVAEAHEGVSVLVVEGTIASASKNVVPVPRLRFAMRNAKGQEIYTWTALPARSVLAPGETLTFRSRLASPPPDGSDVTVRFFSRHDRVAGIQ
jgi:predicted Zn finger-like uncharacterized protein